MVAAAAAMTLQAGRGWRVQDEAAAAPIIRSMSDESAQSSRRARLSAESKRLLDGINELHALEKRKRQVDISTPAFHELATAITAKARDLFRMTTIEEELGDRTETSDVSMMDVDRAGGAGDGEREAEPEGAGLEPRRRPRDDA